MANVLILYLQPIIDINDTNAMICFYESLSKELINNGNNVLCLNVLHYKEYFAPIFDNKAIKYTQEIISKIKTFNPDLIIAFNNQITEEIIQCTNCPILLTEADAISLFSGCELIRKYNDRYYMISFYQGFEEKSCMDFGCKKDHIIHLHMATSVQRENLEKDKNISFIGSCFSHNGIFYENMVEKVTYDKEFYNDLINYYKEPYENYDNFYKKYIGYFNNDLRILHTFMDSRNTTLCAVADLGLHLYGVNFDKLSPELFILRSAFDKAPTYSLKHNQDIYNSSKVNLSISHVQCKGYAFPWRIYDIMASGGLLIASYSKLLADQTSGIVDIPMFKSPNDAHDLCKYALENPSYCSDIIDKSNEFVEKYGRWKSNFEILQDKLNIKLINTDENQGQIIILQSCLPQKPPRKATKMLKRFKTFIYSLCMALLQMPGLYYIFKNKKKLREKISRYWE